MWVPEDLASEWKEFLPALIESGRAFVFSHSDSPRESQGPNQIWTVAEHLSVLTIAYPDLAVPEDLQPTEADSATAFSGDQQEAQTAIVRSWMEVIGPTTATELAAKLRLPIQMMQTALQQLEAQGQVIQGTFRARGHGATSEVEWCDRRLLARIHRRTVTTLRKDIEAVSASDFMRFLFR